jgi:hypothetical protein
MWNWDSPVSVVSLEDVQNAPYTSIQCPQKKARGSGKIGGFLYLLQILQISHYTAETLQNNALRSELLRKKFHSSVLGLANHIFLFEVR